MGFRKIEVQQVVSGRVVPLVLNQLAGDPVLHVVHLGESNAEFWADALAKANTSARVGGKPRAVTPAEVRKARDKNREYVAKYAVKALESVFHDDGRPAGVDDIPDVIKALPDEVFDSVLVFVSNPDNFRERAIDGDPREIAGKS